jgi:hypothetical protein
VIAAPAILAFNAVSVSAQEFKLAPAIAIPSAGMPNQVQNSQAESAGELGAAIDQASSASVETADSVSDKVADSANAKSGDATASSSSTASGSSTTDNTRISYKPNGDAPQADDESKMIAQAAEGSPTSAAVDLAPVKLPERTTAVGNFDQFKTGLLYKLPARMFFNATVENSLRLETNVFQTSRNYRQDMIYRVLPNVNIGYALSRRTRVFGNYFFLRDQYTRDNHTLSRNIHSFSINGAHDIPLGEKTTLTLNMAGRQLLLSRGQPLSDLLPGFQLVRRVGNSAIVYAGVLGQIRFRNTLGKFQEGDQFYSVGGMYRTPRWLFLWDNTFITNFGNQRLRQGPNNQNMIMTLEANYKISPKLPVLAFFRAEPIFNTGGGSSPGFAGVNVRIYGGLKLEMNKPAIFPVKIGKG